MLYIEKYYFFIKKNPNLNFDLFIFNIKYLYSEYHKLML